MLRTAVCVAIGLSAVAFGPAPAAANEPEIAGRVFARTTLAKSTTPEIPDAAWVLDQSVASARLNVEYKHHKTLKLAIEVEFGDGDGKLKDAYLRWRPVRSFTLTAGNIKRPISSIQMEGLWRLPVIERGLLSDLVFNNVSLPLGGRASGLLLEFEPRELPLSFAVGVFEPEVDVTLDATEDVPVDAYARVALAPAKKVEVGASFGWVGYLEKPDQQRGYRHAPVAGIDAHVRRDAFEVWADAFVGVDILPFAIDVATLDLPCSMPDPDGPPVCPPAELIADGGLFLAGRVVGSLRFDRIWHLRELQPFVAGSVVDLNVDFSNDEVAQVGIGTVAWITKRLRAQAQFDKTWAKSDAPTADVTSFALQLGAAF